MGCQSQKQNSLECDKSAIQITEERITVPETNWEFAVPDDWLVLTCEEINSRHNQVQDIFFRDIEVSSNQVPIFMAELYNSDRAKTGSFYISKLQDKLKTDAQKSEYLNSKLTSSPYNSSLAIPMNPMYNDTFKRHGLTHYMRTYNSSELGFGFDRTKSLVVISNSVAYQLTFSAWYLPEIAWVYKALDLEQPLKLVIGQDSAEINLSLLDKYNWKEMPIPEKKSFVAFYNMRQNGGYDSIKAQRIKLLIDSALTTDSTNNNLLGMRIWIYWEEALIDIDASEPRQIVKDGELYISNLTDTSNLENVFTALSDAYVLLGDKEKYCSLSGRAMMYGIEYDHIRKGICDD